MTDAKVGVVSLRASGYAQVNAILLDASALTCHGHRLSTPDRVSVIASAIGRSRRDSNSLTIEHKTLRPSVVSQRLVQVR